MYSSVGFGGGSSYLAILALTGIAFTQIRSIALLCNIMVVSGNVYLFYKQNQLEWKKIIPLVSLSIPLSYLGGYLKINQKLFFIALGFTLCFAAITMWFSKKRTKKNNKEYNYNFIKNTCIGGIIGFISGMVGIGGGIFLAPFLYLTNWSTPNKIAATASFFILVNSFAGLFGQFSNPNFEINWSFSLILLFTVFIGGQLGNKISNRYFTPIQLKKATSILIVLVSLRILYMNVF